ncbi:hypothetical protein [Anaerococcus sp. AGMB09787]|uniref:hypothetical protein n=1 Tax=Anaerococcus sp. AGMB09787 TaxID=2922869 RepID=UPI001FB00FB3|nr:hypothetical protein [Anaerococcus sp. AGMB09787]
MFTYLAKTNKKYFLLGFGLLILFSLDRPILAYLIMYDTKLADGSLDFSWFSLILPNFIYLLYYFMTNYYSELFLDKFEVASRHKLNYEFYASLIKNPRNASNSEIATIFTNDIPVITSSYISGMMSILYLVISFFGSVMILYSINVKILIYLILISVITFTFKEESLMPSKTNKWISIRKLLG